MRYDIPVVFVKQTEGHYDYDLGEHVEGQREESVLMANVTDLGTERTVNIFGDVKENARVVRLMGRYEVDFDHIEIEGVHYTILKTQNLRHKQSLIVQEVST